MSDATIRAAISKQALIQVEQLNGVYRDAIHARLDGTDELAAIVSATRIAWIPLETHMAITRAAEQVLPTLTRRALWRDVTLALADQPVLGVILDGSVRMFGRNPMTLIRIAPVMWRALTRDAGVIRFEPKSKKRALLILDGFPKEHLADFCEGLAGVLGAAFPFCAAEGEVELVRANLRDGIVAYDMTW